MRSIATISRVCSALQLAVAGIVIAATAVIDAILKPDALVTIAHAEGLALVHRLAAVLFKVGALHTSMREMVPTRAFVSAEDLVSGIRLEKAACSLPFLAASLDVMCEVQLTVTIIDRHIVGTRGRIATTLLLLCAFCPAMSRVHTVIV